MLKKALIIALALSSTTYAVGAENRGRIQAQGKQPLVEKSSAWNSATPITAEDGLARLDTVWNSLSSAEKKERLKAYDCAKKFIQSAKASGGVSAPVSKTCQDPNRKDPTARIDIEVIAGQAFK
ncbi:hypothetical protein CB435_22470 [Salmonella enterica subsp. enterica serovar Schwarzengrund]|nr:hypothetical protein [Salmonella enterica subsp. enterica serovar Schwarzengrund]